MTTLVSRLLVAALTASTLAATAPATAHTPGADAGVSIHRGADGFADFIGTTGRGVHRPAAGLTVREAASQHVARLAPTLGVDAADLTMGSARATVDGGSVVRFQQELDGLPVLGGEVVVGMDGAEGMTSLAAELSDAESAPATTYDEGVGGKTAQRAVAKARPDAGPLAVTSLGTWVYDGALIDGPGVGIRTVYRFEVRNGADVRYLVLIDAMNGRVLMMVDELAEALDRRICDQENFVSGSTCGSGSQMIVRTEGSGPAPGFDANAAFDLLGATSNFYTQISGSDLNTLLGRTTLAATVRYCDQTGPCPLDNAFWNGDQMYFGEGYAAADDVVAHELTHGVIERFSDLFYFHESGAINESLADVMGEIVDHRHPSPSDQPGDWSLGEDLPGGALRDVADPTIHGQPDRMTSPLWAADTIYGDNGGVHTNSGVGNKTAYLISQGGTFNGVTVAGIDAGDPTLTKTATLYLDVIEHLVSGSQYDDLGRVLVQSCSSLAAAGTAGFTRADCDAVAAVTQATELALAPTVAGAGRPAEAPDSCPAGTTKQQLSLAGWAVYPSTANGGLWFGAPNSTYGIPANSRDATPGSWFGFDPDPAGYGDPSNSSLGVYQGIRLPAGQQSYLRFSQWRLFEWTPGQTTVFDDGGGVRVFADDGTGTYTYQALDPSAWDNGPHDDLKTTDYPGFGGDSNGWMSSRLDLTSLAGKTIKPYWTVYGDSGGSYIGWFLDGIELYTCTPPPPPPVLVAPGAPVRVRGVGGVGTVTLDWNPPTVAGSGIKGYRVTRNGVITDVGPSKYRMHWKGVGAGTSTKLTVRALGRGGLIGPARSVVVRGVGASIHEAHIAGGTSSDFRITGRLWRAGKGTSLAGRSVMVQLRRRGTNEWLGFDWATTASDGTFRFRIYDNGELFRVVYFGNPGEMGTVTKSVSRY